MGVTKRSKISKGTPNSAPRRRQLGKKEKGLARRNATSEGKCAHSEKKEEKESGKILNPEPELREKSMPVRKT